LFNIDLNSSTRDEEPLVNATVNGGRREVLALGDAGKLGGVSAVRGVLNRSVGTVKVS
jgi:hypothetical protein